MSLKYLLGWSSALCLSAIIAQAQEANEVEKLNQRLKQMQESFDKQQREMKETFERMIREQQAQIEALKTQLATIPTNAVAGAVPTNAPPTGTVTAAQFQELDTKVDQVVESQKKVRPSEFNPSIGFVGETILSYASKPSDQTGSEQPGGWDIFQRSMELDVGASVDPFARGYAVINAEADAATGEASVAVEEAAIQTTSLPWNLELKGGRFFGEFGRLSYIHDHELPFVNRPLVLDQYIGGESQTDGLQANWLPPIGHYISLTLGAGDKFGDDPNAPGTYRAFSQLDFWGRLSSYVDLSPDWQLEGGVSGLWGPRTGSGVEPVLLPDGTLLTPQERRVAGLDLRLSYVPLRNNQFRSLVWGTEVLYSDNNYQFTPLEGPSSFVPYNSSIGAVGLYSYITYKWSRRWSAGFLFNWVENPLNASQQEFSYSPYITFAISHWNFLRLQYTYTDFNSAYGLPANNAVFLQWAWIIGSHSHGWQAR
jgi:hypothetical protein